MTDKKGGRTDGIEEGYVFRYDSILEDFLESGKYLISDIRPSDWAEKNIIMPKPFPGPLRYEKTPYTREIIDCFAQDHPAQHIAVMGSAQFGKTGSILVPLIGFLIANNPGNIIMTVGHESLIQEAMNRIDYMLDNSGLRSMIKPSAQRAKSQKTGDTNTYKEFPNGYIKVSAASNEKIWQQADYKFGLIDDFDRVKSKSKAAGDVRDLIEKRFTAYSKSKKILYLSSPDREENSNILKVYLMGDQRKFMVPCPCCGAAIELLWTTQGPDGKTAGITWKLNEDNTLDPESVGYICQECGDFFTDQYKSVWVNQGFWKATAKAFRPEYVSYHMNCLYSPVGMDDWLHYVYKYLECHPVGQARINSKYQTFLNLNLGLPYAESGEAIKANALQKNARNYQVGEVPDAMSMRDGNGRIVMLTCACDLNGLMDDARLDYEVVAWSESGATYSVKHGSIGTFIPRENQKKIKEDRDRWTYEHNRPNSVWAELDKVIGGAYKTDDQKREMGILMTGIDVGYLDKQIWEYIDNSRYHIRGVKGDKEDRYLRYGVDVPTFKRGREREKLYILQIGLIKDDLSDCVKLRWDSGNDLVQPAGFLNFPTPADGLYGFKNYYEHWESEHRVLDTKEGQETAFRWVKVSTVAQNHMFDCRVYNMAIRDILVAEIGKELKRPVYLWNDLVNTILKR